jgi:glycosyltransferase involved in cell wall biosynthesis
VLKLGYREPAIVARLMASADAVVVPSTYEGFGLPALEAMAAGAPVVAADAGALPEVCDDAALLVRPRPGDLADGLRAAVNDEALRTTLIGRGRTRSSTFTWAKSARSHLAAYEIAFG